MHPTKTKVQKYLGIDFAPARVQAHGLREAHRRPYVSRGKNPDGGMALFRVAAADAWDFPMLEIGRTGNSWPALILDIDQPHALEHVAGLYHDGLIPCPNWTVERTANGHAHACYTLARPVLYSDGMRQTPILTYGRISEYYREATGADAGYTGYLTHNPTHGQDLFTTWQVRQPYSLQDLSDYIPRGWRAGPPTTDAGSSMYLFRAVMAWAGKTANRGLPVLDQLQQLNLELKHPRTAGQLASIARSVERYRSKWEADGWHQESFIVKQREAGKASGQARRLRVQERDETIRAAVAGGQTYGAVALDFDLSRRQVIRICKRAGGDTNTGRGVTRTTKDDQVEAHPSPILFDVSVSLSVTNNKQQEGGSGGEPPAQPEPPNPDPHAAAWAALDRTLQRVRERPGSASADESELRNQALKGLADFNRGR